MMFGLWCMLVGSSLADDAKPLEPGVTTVDAEALRMLPVWRSVGGIVQLTPGVSNSEAMLRGLTDHQQRIDGVSTRDPLDGQPAWTVPLVAIESVRVVRDGMDATYGPVTGAVIDVQTREAGSQAHGGGSIHVLPFMGHQHTTLAAHANGPLPNDDLSFVAAVEGAMVPNISDTTPRIRARTSLTWRPSPLVHTTYSGSVARAPSPTQRETSTRQAGTVVWAASDTSELEVRAAGLLRVQSSVPRDPVLRSSAPTVYLSGPGDTSRSTYRAGTEAAFRQRFRAAGDHRLAVGLGAWQTAARVSQKARGTAPQTAPADGSAWVGDGYAYFAGDGVCNEDNGYADCDAVVQYERSRPSRRGALQLHAYAQDDWTIADRLTLHVGGRLDREVARVNGQRANAVWMPAPRVGMTLDPGGKGRTQVVLRAGRFHERLGLRHLAALSRQQSAQITQYQRGDGGYEEKPDQGLPTSLHSICSDRGVFPGNGGTCDGLALRPARRDVVYGALARRLGSWTAQVSGTLSQNTGQEDATLSGGRDQNGHQFRYYGTSMVTTADLQALELSLQHHGPRLTLWADYTLSHYRDIRWLRPGDLFFDDGIDRETDGPTKVPNRRTDVPAHLARVASSIRLGQRVGLGAVYRLEAGRRIVTTNGLHNEAPDHLLDLRVSYHHPLASERELHLSADIFNLLGVDTDGALPGAVSYESPARMLQLGAAISY